MYSLKAAEDLLYNGDYNGLVYPKVFVRHVFPVEWISVIPRAKPNYAAHTLQLDRVDGADSITQRIPLIDQAPVLASPSHVIIQARPELSGYFLGFGSRKSHSRGFTAEQALPDHYDSRILDIANHLPSFTENEVFSCFAFDDGD